MVVSEVNLCYHVAAYYRYLYCMPGDDTQLYNAWVMYYHISDDCYE